MSQCPASPQPVPPTLVWEDELRELLRVVTQCRELLDSGVCPALHVRRAVATMACGDPGREGRLLDLLRSSCAWLFADDASDDGVRLQQLSHRERDTLRLLLTGAAEKEVARQLRVSRHTAHDYVKTLYRKLGVTSRAELMARARPR